MLIFDGHNDTLTRFHALQGEQSFFEDNTQGCIDLPRARRGRFGGGIFAIYTPPPWDSPERDPMYGLTFHAYGYDALLASPIDPDYADAYSHDVIDFAYELEAESDGDIKIATTAADIEACFEADRLAMVLGLEGAEAIEADLSNLALYYARGIRSLGLVWSRPNVFGEGVPFRFPHSPDTGDGLTAQGRDLVRACNELGIMLDLAHLNARGFFDVARLSTAPLVVTHTDVYAISPSSRNLTDIQIETIAASGGVIGINFETLNTHPHSSDDSDVPLTQITQHIDYIVERVGIDHVAFGSDFDGASMPDALNDVTGLPGLIEQLYAQGYDQTAVEKIAYRNWLRVFKTTWKA